MPKFELLPLNEAVMKSAQNLQEYVGYIEQLGEGRAGRLQASDGERIGAIRRRLGAAAKLAGKDLVIKRVGEEILFWPEVTEKAKPTGRRGRPRKGADGAS